MCFIPKNILFVSNSFSKLTVLFLITLEWAVYTNLCCRFFITGKWPYLSHHVALFGLHISEMEDHTFCATPEQARACESTSSQSRNHEEVKWMWDSPRLKSKMNPCVAFLRWKSLMKIIYLRNDAEIACFLSTSQFSLSINMHLWTISELAAISSLTTRYQ